MKKNIFFIIFMTLGLLICALPFVGMAWARSDEAIGNETQTVFPKITDSDGKFNYHVLDEMGSWFETHYAYRPQLIDADAKVQRAVFKESNTDSVTVGKDGWLFYSSTTNDFMGRNTLTERQIFNLANNISIMQRYVEGQGCKFLFMIPPNKNSLYGENMPYYYSVPESFEHGRDHFAEALADAGVNYLDLFEMFGKETEVLYLKEDSHWNNEGARLVYNQSLDILEVDHESYDTVPVERLRMHAGDLAAMIFPASNNLEWDYAYEPKAFEYLPVSEMQEEFSVEDPRIHTMSAEGKGNLVMYRDSFGNTLIPFMGGTFGECFFSKAIPYDLANDMKKYDPDVLIVEMVERNIRNLIENAPVLPALKTGYTEFDLMQIAGVKVMAEACMANMTYVSFSGTVDKILIDDDDVIFVGIPDKDGNMTIYEAFTVTSGGSDYSFIAYLPQSQTGPAEEIDTESIRVFTERTGE